MERMDGEQLNNAKLSTEERRWCNEEIARITAKFHKVSNDKFGYLQNELYDNWYLALKSMIENLIRDIERTGRHTKRGKKLLVYAEKYKDILKNVPASMVNCDLWYGNILCVKSEDSLKLIIIDPERTFWGDCMFDFANLEFAKMLDKKEMTISAYNKIAKTTVNCSKEEMIRFAFGIGYLALVQEAEKYYRYTPHHFGWWRNVFSCLFLYKNSFKILSRGLK